MQKVLIAVDDTRGTKNAVDQFIRVCKCMSPKTVLLLYVEKFEGRSLMTEMLGEAEMSTLSEVLRGTEYKAKLDEKARKILGFYKSAFDRGGISGVETRVREGHPAEEILKASKEEGADMIVIGARGNRSTLLMGSVSREVANHAEVPVLLVR